MDDVDRDMNIVGLRTRWMDDVDRDMNIDVGHEQNKWILFCGQRTMFDGHEHCGTRTRWMDDVDRDMNIVGLENKMDGRCGQRHEHCGTENKMSET